MVEESDWTKLNSRIIAVQEGTDETKRAAVDKVNYSKDKLDIIVESCDIMK